MQRRLEANELRISPKKRLRRQRGATTIRKDQLWASRIKSKRLDSRDGGGEVALPPQHRMFASRQTRMAPDDRIKPARLPRSHTSRQVAIFQFGSFASARKYIRRHIPACTCTVRSAVAFAGPDRDCACSRQPIAQRSEWVCRIARICARGASSNPAKHGRAALRPSNWARLRAWIT
jgi:hypothetical protein